MVETWLPSRTVGTEVRGPLAYLDGLDDLPWPSLGMPGQPGHQARRPYSHGPPGVRILRPIDKAERVFGGHRRRRPQKRQCKFAIEKISSLRRACSLGCLRALRGFRRGTWVFNEIRGRSVDRTTRMREIVESCDR